MESCLNTAEKLLVTVEDFSSERIDMYKQKKFAIIVFSLKSQDKAS